MTEPAPDQPTNAPDWAFSPDSGLKCPECDTLVIGLNWVMTGDEPDVKATGMTLIPCDHTLDMAVWELKFSGRSRQFGTVIRTPMFDRKVN